MAKSYIPFVSPCKTYGALLERNVMASRKYHEATSALVSLAGHDIAAGFAEAKRDCEACLDECKRTASAIRAHKAAHGC